MNKAVLAKIISLVPHRVARRKSGSRFLPGATGHAQVAHLSQLLHWQSPLTLISEADQRSLGALAPHAAQPRHEEDDDVAGEYEDAPGRV
jgi:hypothetical protein